MSFVSTALLALVAGAAANEYYGPQGYGQSSAAWGPESSSAAWAPEYSSAPAVHSSEAVKYSSAEVYHPMSSSVSSSGDVKYYSSTSELKPASSSSVSSSGDVKYYSSTPVYHSMSTSVSSTGDVKYSSTSSSEEKKHSSVSSGNGYYPHSKSSGDVYVTQVVTAITTYCPSATTLTHGGKTYTVTKPTTLTITDCPCQVTTPWKSLPPASVVTVVVPTYTTVCPSPTTVTIESKTYTVSSSTTITISSCPGGCTVTTPVSMLPPPVTTSYAAPSAGVPSAGVPVGSGTAYFPGMPKASSSYAPVSSTPASYQGGAEKVGGSAALLLGALGLLAL